MKTGVLLATNPAMNAYLELRLDGKRGIDILERIAAGGPAEGGSAHGWRVKLRQRVPKLARRKKRRLHVVLLVSDAGGDVLGMCQDLLEKCPHIAIVTIPPDLPRRPVVFVYRRSTTVAEVLAQSWKSVVDVIRAAGAEAAEN